MSRNTNKARTFDDFEKRSSSSSAPAVTSFDDILLKDGKKIHKQQPLTQLADQLEKGSKESPLWWRVSNQFYQKGQLNAETKLPPGFVALATKLKRNVLPALTEKSQSKNSSTSGPDGA